MWINGVIRVLIRALLGWVNYHFPIEFTKVFSQMSLCLQQNFFSFFCVKVFFIHNAPWLVQSHVQPSSYFRNLPWLLCFLFLAFYYVMYREGKHKFTLRQCFFCFTAVCCVFFFSSFFDNLNRKIHTLNYKAKCLYKLTISAR